MRVRPWIFLILMGAFLALPSARGDQLILKNGKEFSGKLVRADSDVVEFRIQGKVETFSAGEVAQIVFKEPELVTPPAGRSISTPAAGSAPRTEPSGNPEAGRVVEAPSPAIAPAVQSSGPSVTLPAGTSVQVRTTEEINTDSSKAGDAFSATLAQPLKLGSEELAPAGSEVKGQIAWSEESGAFSGQSELILELVEIKIREKTYTLRTSDYMEVGASKGKRTAATVGGAAAVGAVIGAILGGGKGAAIGAGTGAAVGTGVQVLTRGQTLKVPAETLLEFKLQHPLTIDLP